MLSETQPIAPLPRHLLLRGLVKLLGWALYFAAYCVGVIAGGLVGALFLPLLGFVYVLAELGSDDPCSGDKHWSGRAFASIHGFAARFVGKVNADGWVFCSGLCGIVFYLILSLVLVSGGLRVAT